MSSSRWFLSSTESQGQALWGVQQAVEKGSQRIWYKEEASCISSFLSKTVTSSTSQWESAKILQMLFGKDLSGTAFIGPVASPPSVMF